MKKLFLIISAMIVAAGTLTAQEFVGGTSHVISIETIRSQYASFAEGTKTYYVKTRNLEGQQLYARLNAVQTYVDFFANQNYKNVPDWEQNAINLIKEGNFENAIQKYQEQNLLKRYSNGEPVYGSLERYVILLELSGDRSNTALGLNIMQQVVKVDSTSIGPLFMLVNLASDLHQGNLADAYMNAYQDRLGSDRRAYTELMALHATNALRRSRPNDALRWGTRAVILYDSLATVKNDPYFDAIQRARLHLTMGRIQYKLSEKPEGIFHLRKSYELFEYLGSQSPNVHFTERIRSLYNMAPLCADLSQYLLADSIYREVDATAAWLFESNESQQTEFMFNTLRLRGLSAYFAGNHVEAHQYFRQAEERLNKMETMAPGKNLEAYENLNFNIASVYYQQGNLEKALEYNTRVLNMVLKDTEHDEKRHNSNLTYCYKYIGNTHFAIAYKKYLDSKKKKTKEVMNHYIVARENYYKALKFTPREAESQAKFNLCTLIIQGMEKPMKMPKGF
ncbi:MAG: hypothetical protein IJP70_12135 [Bacteroidales bacterium]|nr:hypothetical protein [Bacteroidales bacterium]